MKTQLTELLKIKYPIIQSAMNYVAYPSLVAAVSNAGGLGILGAAAMSADEVRENIRKVRELTDNPFGVNVLATSPALAEVIEVLIDERVPVASYGRGDPAKIIEETKSHGILNIPTVGAVRHAEKVVGYGADAVIVQGMEGGGHTGYVASTVLIPLVVNAVEVPVVAAGGFCDAQGLVAALALGAEGIAMGTRFALSKESQIPDNVKQRYLRSSENDAVITEHVTGTRCRGLLNKLVEHVEARAKGTSLKESITELLDIKRTFNVPLWKVLLSGLKMKREYKAGLDELGNITAGRGRMRKALLHGDEEGGFMPCGQVCGRINEILSCQEIIEQIVTGAEEIFRTIGDKIEARLPEVM